ncbi:MAG: hypothetical protein A4E58_01433 [Syntrophorhabdus sp. PtaB.Bin006]|nr:MAG: hypothetical protein A4E58_01433 [Syntrophorhabdus sp. PtaB.Bin006]
MKYVSVDKQCRSGYFLGQFYSQRFNCRGFWGISFETQLFIFFDSIVSMITIGSDVSAGRITVKFPYSPEVVAKIRTVKARQWHDEEKYWSFPYSKTTLNEILAALAGEEVEINPSLDTLSPPSLVDQLLERVRHLIRLKHYSIRTEKSYLSWIRRYLHCYHDRDPREMGSVQIETHLSHLAVDLTVSASPQNQAFNALLFLYREVLKMDLNESINAIRAKKPQQLPTVMTRDETMRLIQTVPTGY